MIYFTDDAIVGMYRALIGVLRLGGVLFAGATEIVNSAQNLGRATFGLWYYRGDAASRGLTVPGLERLAAAHERIGQ